MIFRATKKSFGTDSSINRDHTYIASAKRLGMSDPFYYGDIVDRWVKKKSKICWSNVGMVLRIKSRPSVVSMVGQPKTMEYFLFFPLDCIFLGLRAHSKGQLISKYIFGIFNSSTKRTKNRPNYYGTSSWIVFVRVLEELKTQ